MTFRTLIVALAVVAIAAGVSAKDVYASPYGDDSNSGLTPRSPVQHLDVAFNTIAEDGDTVHLAKGTFMGTGNTGVTIATNITVVGDGAPNQVVVRCSSTSSVAWYFKNSLSVQNVQIDGCTSTGIHYSTNGSPVNDIVVKNTIFSNTYNGIYAYVSSGSAAGKFTVINSTFADMTSAGFYHYSYKTITTSATFTDCVFSGKSSRIYADGLSSIALSGNRFIGLATTALSAMKTDTVTIANSRFESVNSAVSNYPVPMYLGDTVMSAKVTGVVFADNHNGLSTRNFGGAIYSAAKELRVFDSLFFGNSVNSSMASGGAIYATSPQVIIYRSAFVGNVALAGTSGVAYGGAIYAAYASNGGVHVADSLFFHNLAVGPSSCGGGATADTTTIDIQNSVLLANSAAAGGAYCCVNGGHTLQIHSYVDPDSTSCDDAEVVGTADVSAYRGLDGDRAVLLAWMDKNNIEGKLRESFLQAIKG